MTGELVTRDILHPKLGHPSFIYSYFDLNQNLVGYICRFEKGLKEKEIRPYRLKEGKWFWEHFDNPTPLFQLANLLTKPKARVLLVEGEKTAEVAQELFPDYVVMTWAKGSNGVPHADFSPLKGREVLLLPDADSAGKKAMKHAAAFCLSVGAKSASIVNLPASLPEGWDVADEFPTDFSFDDMQGCIESAMTLLANSSMEIMDVADLLKEEITPINWLVENIIPAGFTILAGAPKAGKSFLLLNIAACLVTGSAVFDAYQTKKGKVLYLALEDTKHRLSSRLHPTKMLESLPAGEFFFALRAPKIDDGLPQIRTNTDAAGHVS